MAMSLADQLTTGTSLPYPTAIEVARQMTAGIGNGNADRLIALGIPPMKATELARQINAGAFSAHLLAMSMWDPASAKVLKIASGL